MKETPQQLNALLRQFADEAAARKMADEIQQMDRLLASQASPDVSRQTLSAIKMRVRQRLADRNAAGVRRQMGMRLAWVAAAMVLVAGAIFFFTASRPAIPPQTVVAASLLWEDSSDNDPAYSLATQIETTAGQIDSVRGQTRSWFDDENSLTVEIQDMKTVVSNTDFWKG
jgi:hypothetical protein